MKQFYILFLGIACLFVACTQEQSPPAKQSQTTADPSHYELITARYQQKNNSSFKASFISWGWLKRIATADATAIAAYVAKNGKKSDWKEALLIGAAASVGATISTKARFASAVGNSSSAATLIVPDIQSIQKAKFDLNRFDELGYLHYVLVNEALKDSTLTAIPPQKLTGVLYDQLFKLATNSGISVPYDQQDALLLLNTLQQDTDGFSSATLFPFEQPKEVNAFTTIMNAYESTFNTLTDTAVFTAYSKEMEAAVIQDTALSQPVKDCLLLTMATYRFGYTYYSFHGQ